MSTQIQRRRGTTAQHASFTGAIGETTIDTDKEVVVVHDGTQVGGYPLMRENASNSALALGSAATPSLKFTGDTNTGIYSPGADQVAISTGGTGRLFVDASGRVGVGTASPDANLTIGGLTNTGGQSVDAINVNRTDGLRLFGVKWDVTSNEVRFSGNSKNYVFRNGSSEAETARITSAGLVGIGTSAPGGLLEVKSADQNPNLYRLYNAYNAGASSWGVDFYRDTDSGSNLSVAEIKAVRTGGNASELKFGTSSTPGTVVERVRISSAGNVGIGTTAPQDALHIAVASAVLRLEDTDTNCISTIQGTAAGLVLSADATNSTASSFLGLSVDGTERARIDSSGRLLVGTSSASTMISSTAANLQVQSTGTTIAIGIERATNDANPGYLVFRKTRSTSSNGVTVVQNGDAIGNLSFTATDGTAPLTAASVSAAVDGTPGTNDMPGRLVFSTTADGASAPTERMRITSNGDVIFGSTGGTTAPTLFFNPDTGGGYFYKKTNSVNARNVFVFENPNGVVGSITTATSATSYNTSSDYRLKENITPVADGITRLQQLKPSRFNFIADPDTVVDGFLAHEAQAVVPECVTGTKDEVDADGNPVYQGIDQSKLVPLLTAALQEAIAKIESLEGMVAVNNITIDEQQHQLSTLAARLTALESA
jgi:hypothetical protein